METRAKSRNFTATLLASWSMLLALLIGMAQVVAQAQTLTINVVDPAGNPLAVPFRWLVEEDATKDVDFTPAQPGRDLSLSFHTSYMPVAGKGTSATPSIALDADKRYFVSVLPNSGYQMNGAAVKRGQTSVTVTVNPQPIPTAQISVFAFIDNQPINGAPDLPEEAENGALADFTVLLYEAGGTYGQSGDKVKQDAFGNPIGTKYDAAGNPILPLGDGTLKTGPDGTLLIKNLAPGKYTIQIVPPVGSNWHQTHTIEGTKGIDAWVKPNEPSYFQEFGPPGHHVFIGFVPYFSDPALNGSASITGTVVNMHMSRPPEYAFYNGHPVPNCRIGLNELAAAGGRALFAGACNEDSSFEIPNVPPGDYQLVIWDEYLDVIMATHNVSVPAGAAEVALQEVPVFSWFARLENEVFYDSNQNGFRDEGEVGMPEQAINLRFRDGSIYQSFPTDLVGYVPFDEVFPFFNWLVAEVDYLRFKATGVTVTVDAGGPIDENEPWSYGGKLNPQEQTCSQGDVDAGVFGCNAVGDPLTNPVTGTTLARTETGPVLLEGFQAFLGQTSVMQWGKHLYAPGENGGISGIVTYATTRAEDDPRLAAAENWEPGIPRVQVNLYKDCNADKAIDRPDCTALGVPGDPNSYTLADVDNWPFGNFPNADDGDIDRNGNNVFDQGDALQVVTTDSWDDNLPSGCQGEVFIANGQPTDCYDGLRNFNQVRPSLFDGGFAFNDIPAGTYIVEAITPNGYEHVKEQDKNVDFGDEYVIPELLPAECVGDSHTVPPYLTLFPGQMVDAAYANQPRPLCDRKQLVLQDRQNGAVNFFMFTEVPAAAHIVGMILNDVANEFDPNAPTFGEKQAPSFVPISIRDWTGREISRVYSDQYGTFNALVPSTFSMNLPMPSGVSPNMLTACMNSPGPIVDERAGSPTYGQRIIDPYFNRQYTQFCYTFQYLPGKTTYLDTPVLPIAAFAGPGQFPLDCEYPDHTPMIAWASGQNGPWVPSAGNDAGRTITIQAAGPVEVPNPAYDGGVTPTVPKNIVRDYGFGTTPGSVTIGTTPLTNVVWDANTITATVPANTPSGQLMVTRGDNQVATKTGLTFNVGGSAASVIRVPPGGSIQAAIDAAPSSGSPLILVPPGIYEELVIMHKPVRLQGWGAHSTTINALKAPAEKLANWRTKLASLLNGNQFSLLPGQEVAFNGPDNEPVLFGAEEGPGVLVVGNANNAGNANEFGPSRVARIDGFTITGSDHGGGVFASGYARNLQVSNNRIVSNQGTYGGGIRIGHAVLLDEAAASGYTNSQNTNVNIHHNQISQNGSLNGAGGGISLYTGSNGYQVRENTVCGNFAGGDGGGIGHLGLSDNGTIANNAILFNQSFNQGVGVNGGGVFIGGAAPIAPNVLSSGAGDVDVLANLVQGNQAGAGDGGGIRLQFVNGTDVLDNDGGTTALGSWHRVNLYNNIMVDNMAGLAGGGISLQDSVRVFINHNTVANNDSTATAGAAFAAGSPNLSTAQPAGIVARAHSSALKAVFDDPDTPNGIRNTRGAYSRPDSLGNNIVWHNRSFYWQIDYGTSPSTFGLMPVIAPDGSGAVFWDLAVLGTAAPSCLAPNNSVLTTLNANGCIYDASNGTSDPQFVAEYYNNGNPGQTIQMPELTTSLATAAALDEGGNFIDVRFWPLTQYTVTDPSTGAQGALYGDYHIIDGSPAEQLGDPRIRITPDYDGDIRPNPVDTNPDAGADERL
ncbi:MAG: hypothetical protein WC474_05545 [Hydrogenophilaceae bacterium]